MPNLEFILCLGDGAPESYHKQDFMIMDDFSLQAPVLARCTLSSAKYICLVPDYASFSVHNLIDHVLDANAKSPWESKIFKACWRGVPSDVHVNGIDRFSYEEISNMYANKARYVISVMSNLYPDYVDAGITSMYPHTPEFNKFLINSQVIKSEMSIPDHIKHACLPCLDGWMSTYPGYIWRLASNSLVLKQDSNHILWFFKGLKPYEHYVTIDSCCRDLIEKVN